MTPDEVLEVLRDAVATVLEHDRATVTRETRFVEDLAADSLAIVEIVEIVEETLAARSAGGLRIDDEVLDDLATVGDVIDHALARL